MPKLKFFIIALIAFFSLAGTKPADAQTYTVLHTFTGPDGANPMAGLTMDAAGNLYGTTLKNGAQGKGTVFKLDAGGKLTVLSAFVVPCCFVFAGAHPVADLILGADGNLYGTTLNETTSSTAGFSCDMAAYTLGDGCGTVFRVDMTGTETVLHRFNLNVAPGALPMAGLVEDASGNLYGTSSADCFMGLPQQWGTVFKIDSGGSFTNLHVFSGGADGGCPMGPLVRDAAGNLYGTTAGEFCGPFYGGSSFFCGPTAPNVVFKLTLNLDSTWTYSVLHTFRGYDGLHPHSGLIFDAAGNLYGTTYDGGGSNNCPGGCGAVFKLTPNQDGTWTERVLHTFANRPSAHPHGGLVFDAAGNLYGTTVNGSTGDSGTVFKMSPNLDGSWSFKLLHTFAGKPAMHPYGTLIIDKAGNLYGTTADCGAGTGCYGTIFKITP